jgi:hypothetical protein
MQRKLPTFKEKISKLTIEQIKIDKEEQEQKEKWERNNMGIE